MMTDKTLDDLKVDAHIAVLHTKVDSLIEKQKELTARVRANERVVAIVSAIGIGAGGIFSTAAFAPPADATEFDWSVSSLLEKVEEWKFETERTSIDDMLYNALASWEERDGSNDPTESEELLQFPSSQD